MLCLKYHFEFFRHSRTSNVLLFGFLSAMGAFVF